MKKTKNSAWKRVAAGSLSMALVAGAMPANVGGFLTGGNALVANAETYTTTVNLSDLQEGDILKKGTKVEGIRDDRMNLVNENGTLLGKKIPNPVDNDYYLMKIEPNPYGDTFLKLYVYKQEVTNLLFDFNEPSNLTYNGNSKTALVDPKSQVEGMGTVTVHYYSDPARTSEVNEVVNVGTYYVGITVTEGASYKASSAVVYDDSWTFTITKATPTASDFTFFQPENLYYNGDPKAANVTTTAEGMGQLTVKYKAANQTSWTDEVPTDIGTYSVGIEVDEGDNYEASNDVIHSDNWTFTIGKATLTAGTDYTAPTGSDDLKYKAADIPLLEDGNTGSVTTVDSNTGEPVGTMEYGIAGTKEATNIIKNNETQDLNVEEVKVGDIYSPVGNKCVNIRISNYGKFILDDKEHESDFPYTALAYQNGRYYMTANEYTDLKAGCDAVRVKEIRSDAIVFESYNSALETIDWKTTVPTAKDVGEYKVYYRVKGDATHNDTAPAYVTSKIDYKKSTLTLAASLGAFKVTEVANGTETEVTADNGVYTLSATKTYKIYTENTVSTDEKSKYRLTEGFHNKENNDDVFEYEYTLELAVDPAFDAYNLSHLSNWTGKVNSTDPTKLYIADGEVTPNTGKLAATLKANSTYYYGDLIDDSSVEIEEAYKNLINVKKIYFSDSTGANVDINNAKYGTYTLTAEIVVDNNANGKFDDKGVDLSYTVYKDVEYKARPMEKNDYFVETPDGKIKLTVDNGTVTVPEKYYVYSGISDIPGGSDSDKKYVTTEKSDALSVIFSKCEEKQTFTYNGTEQKPTIIVKNGGNNADVVASIPATDTADAVAKDYIDGVKAETDAGDYSFKLTAEAGTTEAPANYSGAITVKWTIAQADISEYISVAPKNNVDTDNVVGNDAIVYDGAVLDGTDFEVKTNEAYAALATDSPVKALVDEFIAQLKGTPAVEADPANNIEAQPAVPAKTVVAAEATNAGEYPKSVIPTPKENTFLVTPKEENSYNIYFSDLLRKSDNTDAADDDIIIMPKANDNDASVEFKKLDFDGFTVISVYSDGRIAYEQRNTDGLIFVDATLPNTTEYGWYIEQTGTRVLNQGTDDEKTVKVFTISAKKYPTGELKNAGEHKANVTVSNSNFKSVKIEGVDVEIAKRDVTLTPDDDLSITYRDTVMPDLTYTIEDAKADGLTGVVAADKALFQKTTGEGADAVTTNTGAIYVDELVQEDTTAAVQFVYALDENNATDYTTAGLNNAGSYKYAAINDAKFDNYNIVLPVDIAADEAQGIEEYTAPTFTVAPLNLNNIADLQIVLNGVTDGWTQNGNSGYYTYDGSTKQVQVKSVSKANTSETAQTQTVELLASETSGVDVPYIKDGFTLKFGYWSSQDPNVIGSISSSADSVKIIVPADKIATKITVDGYYYDFVQGQYITFSDLTNFTTEFEGNYTGTVSMKDVINYDDLTSYHNGTISFSKITVTYKDADEYTLTADTDYTVGGATKRASAGTHNVQIMGKGNYTGVTTAPWDITEAQAGESTLLIDNTPSNEYNGKSYDGKAVTANVSFGDGASAYYVADAETDIKYYENNNVLESAPVDAGTYKVVATITCDGYATKTIEKTFNISPAVLTVDASANTKAITYGDKLPAVTQADIDAIVGLTDDDKADFQKFFTDGKLGLGYAKKNNANAQLVDDTSKLTFTLNGTLTQEEVGIIQQFSNNYNTSNFYWNVITNAKSIKDSSIKVEFTEGDTAIINPDGTFASDSAIKVYDTAILNQDGKATELVELGENNAATADYELTVESTATEGVYTLEIVGKNNYRGVRKIEFKAITAAKAATKLDIEFVETYVSNNKNRIKFNASAAVKDGYTVKETGVIYFNAATGTPEAELTMDNVDGTNIKKARNLADSYTVGLLDNGNGVYARFYTIVNDGTNDYVVYATDEAVVYNYAELSAKSATKLDVDFVETYVSNNKNRIKFNASAAVKDGYTVKETGVIYFNAATGTPEAELTMDNVDGTNIKKARNLADSYTVGLLDNGNGVYARFYTIVNDGTNDYVVYATDEAVVYNYAELSAKLS